MPLNFLLELSDSEVYGYFCFLEWKSHIWNEICAQMRRGCGNFSFIRLITFTRHTNSRHGLKTVRSRCEWVADQCIINIAALHRMLPCEDSRRLRSLPKQTTLLACAYHLFYPLLFRSLVSTRCAWLLDTTEKQSDPQNYGEHTQTTFNF